MTIPALSRYRVPLTTRNLEILIDSGSNLNFIHRRWAKELDLPIDTSSRLLVMIGNGNTMTCLGACKDVELTLGSITFTLDLQVVPFNGADIILGVSWLEALGQVTFDYRRLSITFTVNNSLHILSAVRGSIPTTIPLFEDVTFNVGDQVLVKLQKYRQNSVAKKR
ncbi:hypothetical protein ZOSMA_263G00030 [Zostera marina]|uniref:Peptidase A2 domain-containing protein n=1 Tax=Zostera marina TaxID=29655 RepID=A0A0K9PH64_ZOSMR|nr:hypothetical protein ZOSMA_263G00030 [Zostera marina]